MMFQDARLLPRKTVMDNVGLGLKGHWREEARQALAAVGLEDRAGDWPAALSGGQNSARWRGVDTSSACCCSMSRSGHLMP